MKLNINIPEATVITLSERPYEFNGKSGISYQAAVLLDNSVEKFKLTEAAFHELETGLRYNLAGELFIGNGRCSLKIVGIAN